MPVRINPEVPKRILVVEDNPAHQEILYRITEDINKKIELIPALTAEAAQKELAQETLPDLILLDLNLPKMSGHEFLDLLRTQRRYKELPVVVLTSSDDAQELENLRDRGANGCFTKPTDYYTYSAMMRFISSEWLH